MSMYLDLPLLSSILDRKDIEYTIKPSATILISNIIKELKIKSISLPAFLCEEILLAIYNLDINISFYKLDTEFSPILKKENLESECLFICDYFGYPIKKSNYLKFYLEETKKPVIIDRCHSLYAGIKSKNNNILDNRDNYFMVYSFRKFLPIINGSLLIQKKGSKLANGSNNSFISKHIKVSSYLKKLFKVNLNKNKLANNLLSKFRLLKINKNKLNQINGFNIKTPNLINKEKIELGYFFNSLDIRSLYYLNKERLVKQSKFREKEIDKITQDLKCLIKDKKYKFNNLKYDYGTKYGVPIRIDKKISKNEIENEIIKPFLKINKRVEIFLWPYNTNNLYLIENILLNSIILITPKIKND